MAILDTSVVFLGMQHANTSECCFPHAHECFELNYLLRGKTKIMINNVILPYEEHDFVLVPPGTTHNLHSQKDQTCDNYTIRFSCSSDFSQNFLKKNQIVRVRDYDGTVFFLVSEIFRLYKSWNMENADFFNAYLAIVLMYLQKGEYIDTDIACQRDGDVIEKGIHYINENILTRRIAVSDVAEIVGLSPAHFTRLFQERIGMSPMKYMIEVKMNYAKRLLLERDLSIKEIAALRHYDDQLYFSRLFTKYNGVSPKKYRNGIR